MSKRLIVMGPSGSRKTTLGTALAQALHADFVDADDLHLEANVEKMRRGEPLSDEDRWPWLARVAETIASHVRADRSLVVACSALRRIYRDRLRAADAGLKLIFLNAPAAVLESRLKARPSHFMPAALVASQLATLEPPGADENAFAPDATQPVDRIIGKIIAAVS